MTTYDTDTGVVRYVVPLSQLDDVIATMNKQAERLQAENERLRKDLDYVLDDWGCFKVGHSGGNGIDSVFKAWLYAKGVQS